MNVLVMRENGESGSAYTQAFKLFNRATERCQRSWGKRDNRGQRSWGERDNRGPLETKRAQISMGMGINLGKLLLVLSYEDSRP